MVSRAQDVVYLQRLAGNAAVAASIQRQAAPPGAGTKAGIQPGRFSNSGASLLGRSLGLQRVGPYFVNGIEIVFPLDPGARTRYRELRPRQWSGPEAVYVKSGPPLGSPWQTRLRGPGSGPDDPLPQSQRVDNAAVIYDDSPGPSVLGYVGKTWIHGIQNFTGWVEGRKSSGGPMERLTEVVAWHSVISIWNPDAATGGTAYQANALTRSGTGWVPLGPPAL